MRHLDKALTNYEALCAEVKQRLRRESYKLVYKMKFPGESKAAGGTRNAPQEAGQVRFVENQGENVKKAPAGNWSGEDQVLEISKGAHGHFIISYTSPTSHFGDPSNYVTKTVPPSQYPNGVAILELPRGSLPPKPRSVSSSDTSDDEREIKIARPWTHREQPHTLCLAAQRNYEVYIGLRLRRNQMARLLAVLDPRVVPKFIREDLLPAETFKSIRKETVPIIREANRRKLSLMSTVKL